MSFIVFMWHDGDGSQVYSNILSVGMSVLCFCDGRDRGV